MSFPDICPACGRLADKPHYDGCDADKAALFDVLAARIEAGAWTIPDGVDRVTIAIRRTGEHVHGATLAEAIEKAMKAEAPAVPPE